MGNKIKIKQKSEIIKKIKKKRILHKLQGSNSEINQIGGF